MASDKLELSIICPPLHHEEELINNEFKGHIKKTTFIWEGISYYGTTYKEIFMDLDEIKPDLVLLLGDRYEINAAATAATLLNIPIAHIHGGESTKGAFDDALRNSITMMSTYHFTANEEYANNVARMIGKNVYNTGSPGLDCIAQLKDDLQGYTIDKPFILCNFNPITKELYNTKAYITHLMAALTQLDEQIIIIRPNIDPENDVINTVIDDYTKSFDHIHAVGNIDHETYLSLMKHALCMVGNSSSGIIEAPSFNLPVVNIGTRQEGRIKAENVIDVCYTMEDILKGIECAKAYDRNKAIINPYGKGDSSRRIVDILEGLC